MKLGVQNGHSMHLVRNKPQATTSAQTSQTQPQQQSSTSQSSPFGSGMFGSGTGNLMPGMNEDQMRTMMDSLLQNEDLLQELLENDPRIRRLTESNPELAHALRDPATLRQAAEAMRNPAMFREMQRNADRAMMNIESHPEGARLLRRLYGNIDESGSELEGFPQNSDVTPTTPPVPEDQPLPHLWAPRGTL